MSEIADEINRLRYASFHSNSKADVDAYYHALSKAFQNGDLIASDSVSDKLKMATDIIRAAERFRDVTGEYFSDTEYDRNGVLADADAELHVLLYDAKKRFEIQ